MENIKQYIRGNAVLLSAILIMIIIITLFIIYSGSDVTDEENGVFIGAVYGDVYTSGQINGTEYINNSTIQVFFHTDDNEPMTVVITNVSRITILKDDRIIVSNVLLNDNTFKIELLMDDIITIPVTSISLEYKLSSYNGTNLDDAYIKDIDISHLNGSGTLNTDDPTGPFVVFDGTIYFNNETFTSSIYTILLNGTKDNTINITGEGDIDLYYIPRIRLKGEIILYDCIELNSNGKEIKKHEEIKFKDEDIVIITISEPDYIDHQGGYLEPWILKVVTTS
jgi:hypothetical protein